MDQVVEAKQEERLKAIIKEAMAELFEERPGLLTGAFTDALEDTLLKQAIQDGLDSEPASREEVMKALDEQA